MTMTTESGEVTIPQTLERAKAQVRRQYSRLIWKSITKKLTDTESQALVEACRQLDLSPQRVGDDVLIAKQYLAAKPHEGTLPRIEVELRKASDRVKELQDAEMEYLLAAAERIKVADAERARISAAWTEAAQANRILNELPSEHQTLFLEKP